MGARMHRRQPNYLANFAECSYSALVSRLKLSHIVSMSKEDQIKQLAEQTRARKNAARTPRRGRPLAKDADKALMKTKPWVAEGMSRASWYRRQKLRHSGVIKEGK